MSNEADMSTPVTRGELREELGRFGQELREEFRRDFTTRAEFQDEVAKLATKEELRQEVAKLATKTELDLWGGALLARMDEMKRDLQADLAGIARAMQEWLAGAVSAVDDKYKDIPGRVVRLEATVFPGERRR